ncbi:hypothetical protein Sango_1748700 [Sesamum angolense]|uniref:Uncharacterized protein n=1 Tax=Sesamum angolense TaxID=2727404 RepID=A0AAE2BSA7_9LAMI|nr:hypothetical protein Sango_1748700 [Sesamum angolense]
MVFLGTSSPRTNYARNEKIDEVLRTTHRTAAKVTPYSLVYGVEVVLPFESRIPSLRIAIQERLTIEDNALLRLEELEALDGKKLKAQQQLVLSSSHDKTNKIDNAEITSLSSDKAVTKASQVYYVSSQKSLRRALSHQPQRSASLDYLWIPSQDSEDD